MFHPYRGVSKMTPIMICFGLLMMLVIWIMYDINKKNYDANVIDPHAPKSPPQTYTIQPTHPTQPQPVQPVKPPETPSVAPMVPIPRPGFSCRRAPKPIEIDGDVSGPEWAEAEVINHFIHVKDGSPARSATQAKVLWDDQYFYFSAIMDDADVFAEKTTHNDRTWYDDVFELFFKPDANKLGYYEFQVNARGTSMEMYLPSRGSGGYERWIGKREFHLEAKAVLRPNSTLNDPTDRDSGWVVEGRIPWTDFAPTGGKPAPGAEWKFALCRYDYSIEYEREDLSSCAPVKDGFHNYENYATLKFVGK